MADANVTPVATGDSSGSAGIPSWVLWLGGLIIVSAGGYFVYTKYIAKPATPGDVADDAENKMKAKLSEGVTTTTAAPVANVVSQNVVPEQQVDDATLQKTVETVKADMANAKGASSPVRTDYDGAYNYQKRNGVWYSAKKSTPNVWASWGLDSNFAKTKPKGWTQAVALLDARYPND